MTGLVVPHSLSWNRKYRLEAARIRTALGAVANAIHHIGSTAIARVLAKPVIDILVEASSVEEVDARAKRLVALGYDAKGAYGIPGRRYFRKDNPQGVREFHVHVFAHGAEEIERHLAFRDYLRSHAGVAREYSELKRALASRHGLDKKAYAAGKDPFVAAVVEEALAWSRT